MTFEALLKEKGITGYALAKLSGIPYTTINDLIHSRSLPKNISLDHALRIARVLEIDVVTLNEIEKAPLTNFKFFRTNLLNDIHIIGVKRWINRTIKNKTVDFYYKNGGIAHALFMLATLDYLSRRNHMPIYTKRYNDLRKLSLDKTLFTGGTLLSFSDIKHAETLLGIKIEPEYSRHNIVEIDIVNMFWW